MSSLLVPQGISTGDTVVSPPVDVSSETSFSYSLSVSETEAPFLLSVRLESPEGQVWRALDTYRISYGGVYKTTQVTGTSVLRLSVSCLSGSGNVRATSEFDAVLPVQPPNLALKPNSILVIGLDRKIQELEAPVSGGGPEQSYILTSTNTGSLGWVPIASTGGTNIAWQEEPTGIIDGVNDTFTLAHIPVDSILLTLDGVSMTEGKDFTRIGNVVTYDPDQIPQIGDGHVATYQY